MTDRPAPLHVVPPEGEPLVGSCEAPTGPTLLERLIDVLIRVEARLELPTTLVQAQERLELLAGQLQAARDEVRRLKAEVKRG